MFTPSRDITPYDPVTLAVVVGLVPVVAFVASLIPAIHVDPMQTLREE